MAHAHHHHIDPETGDRRLGAAIAVNLLLTVVQIAGGIMAGSLALIADAIHNLSDALSLVIAWAARRIARRPASPEMPFGYGRAEVVAALINYTSLILLGLWLAGEAVMRLFDPQPVDGWLVVILAGVALVVDVATALLTRSMAAGSANIRAAFLHNIGDALASVAVIVAGVAILVWDWRLVDPLVTLAIAGGILWLALTEIGGVIRILMLAAPESGDPAAVVAAIREDARVADVHRARLWALGEHEAAFQAHVALVPGAWAAADEVKAALKARLAEAFHLHEVTVEMECAAHACAGAKST
jgi:cobalt-zinc-cadmium efflux system protein